jgi:DNA-binding beta-propeller fold protein YncE
MRNAWLVTSLAALAVAGSLPPLAGAQKGGMDETGPYAVVVGWFKPGIERWDQRIVAVAADTPDRIVIGSNDRSLTLAGYPLLAADGTVMKEKTAVPATTDPAGLDVNQLLVLDGSGRVIENWSQWNALIAIPHSLAFDPYDPERHLWVVDRTGQQILKFTRDGRRLVLKIGETGVAGADRAHFDEPAGLAFLPDGSFYVADGYKNARIVKFDRDGRYLLEWGTKGSGPGQFNLVHAVTVDAQRRVYAADRVNNRIQVFDDHGRFLEQWPNVRSATRVVATEDGFVWASAAGYNRFAKYDLTGRLLYHWGVSGADPGLMDNPHQWCVDQAGNLYVADANNDRVQKFVPRAGADPSHLVRQELVLAR